MRIDDPEELEELQVKGAIRTDFILSAEIMAIALASLGRLTLAMTGRGAGRRRASPSPSASMAPSRIIVKLDDIGLHLAERSNAAPRAVGNGLVHVVPKLLTALSGIGTAAMLWVGGGILLHGLEELHILERHSRHHPRPGRMAPPSERRHGAASSNGWSTRSAARSSG